MKLPFLLCVHAAKQKASLAKSGLTSLATAAGCMHSVSVHVCYCRRVFMSVFLCLSRRGDLIAQLSSEEGPSLMLSELRYWKTQETGHSTPRLVAPPIFCHCLWGLCLCLIVSHYTPTMPTLTYSLCGMSKAWFKKFKNTHCTAVPTFSFQPEHDLSLLLWI